MSGLEIERKFLVVKGGAYKRAAFSCSHIRQGYIPAEGATVRIRTRDDRACANESNQACLNCRVQPSQDEVKSYLTIKGKSCAGGLVRYEFEKEISSDEATELLKLCRGGLIDKHRYLVGCGNHTIEVDEFHGDNDGLVMAEVELGSEDEAFEKPDFLGPEVTADHHFRNAFMVWHPYPEWKEIVPEEYR